jgi:hypothetical protein
MSAAQSILLDTLEPPVACGLTSFRWSLPTRGAASAQYLRPEPGNADD